MTTKRIFVIFIYMVLAGSLLGWSLSQADLAFAQHSAPQRSLKNIAKSAALGVQPVDAQTSSVADGFSALQLSAVNQTGTCTQWHNIVVGETLAKIGKRFGISWRTLAAINNLANPNLIYAGAKLCLSTDDQTPLPTPTAPVPPAKIPTFSIVEVARDQTVSISTKNFPADDRFIVRMGAIGTRGVNGIEVERINSGDGGSFTATFDIPAALKGSRQISIRLESPTSGYFSYNWFYNTTTN